MDFRTLSRNTSYLRPLSIRFLVLSFGLVAVIGAVVLILASSYCAYGPTVSDTGPTIIQLEQLGNLVVLKVHVADVLEVTGDGYKGSWLVKGDALIGVNLRAAKIGERHQEKRQATIILPAPQVLQARVDHSKTKTWDVSKTTWIPFSGDPDRLRDSAMLEAQKLVDFASRNDEAIGKARENALLLLRSMYRLVGWEINVEWERTGVRTPSKNVE